jgi:hypothetical protein
VVQPSAAPLRRGQSLVLALYSHDLNPIEHAFAKFKAILRKARYRTQDVLWATIRRIRARALRPPSVATASATAATRRPWPYEGAVLGWVNPLGYQATPSRRLAIRWATMREYRRASHTVYTLHYHFVFIRKYRKPVLRGDVEVELRDLIREICR